MLSLASVGLFVRPGLNYGIDFVGGIVVEVETQGPADLASLRSGLETLDLGEVGLQEFGADNHVLVRVERQPGGEEAQMAAVAKVKAAIDAAAPAASFERVEVVGPKVSSELYRTGFLAVGFASLAMLIYIWFRFEWHFAVGAIATLVLDVTKTVGFFALTGLDFNLTAIAALLTLIGYSVNDKVVVYDRMRENLRLYKKMPLRELIDLSINQTLARSLYTSGRRSWPCCRWRSGAARGSSFAMPMLFGIVICASSSVFIAAPILLFLGEGRLRSSESPMRPKLRSRTGFSESCGLVGARRNYCLDCPPRTKERHGYGKVDAVVGLVVAPLGLGRAGVGTRWSAVGGAVRSRRRSGLADCHGVRRCLSRRSRGAPGG